jgi:hypothetical protein
MLRIYPHTVYGPLNNYMAFMIMYVVHKTYLQYLQNAKYFSKLV